MTKVSKQEYLEWRKHPVTQVVMEAVEERVKEANEKLLGFNERDFDVFLKGMIRAYHEFITVRPNEVPDLITIEEAAEAE